MQWFTARYNYLTRYNYLFRSTFIKEHIMIGTRRLEAVRVSPWVKLRAYWALIKDLQTGLLLVTGLAGYISAAPAAGMLALLGSLFLAVSGSTVLNMVIDRDIDAKMTRTAGRPLPMGTVSVWEGTVLGLVLASSGVVWAILLSPTYGAIVFAGLFIDVVIYSTWLKRRTPWSTVWGGLAGGMPALAGRALATGRIDAIGLLMAFAVLLWIPTHIMTFSIKYAEDYARAGVPVFPNRYGERVTRLIIGASTMAAVIVMVSTTALIGPSAIYLTTATVLGVVLVSFTIASMVYTTPKLNFTLYKLASLYMLGSMALIILAR